jgi:hypothetical protein
LLHSRTGTRRLLSHFFVMDMLKKKFHQCFLTSPPNVHFSRRYGTFADTVSRCSFCMPVFRKCHQACRHLSKSSCCKGYHNLVKKNEISCLFSNICYLDGKLYPLDIFYCYNFSVVVVLVLISRLFELFRDEIWVLDGGVDAMVPSTLYLHLLPSVINNGSMCLL